jgi:quaternary ammonium compound-resistance protein SugE
MAWVYLLIASGAEIVWAFTLKASDGFTKPMMVLFNVTALLVAVWFLVQAMRVLPLGTAYAVWTGIGVAGAAVLGVAMLGESMTPMRLAAIGIIVAGVAMLKLTDG